MTRAGVRYNSHDGREPNEATTTGVAFIELASYASWPLPVQPSEAPRFHLAVGPTTLPQCHRGAPYRGIARAVNVIEGAEVGAQVADLR